MELRLFRFWAVSSVFLLGLGTLLTAQAPFRAGARHHRYRFVDLGTFGGPVSYGPMEGFTLLNDAGVVATYADISTPDPHAPDGCFNADCFLSHALLWSRDTVVDLGALPGVTGSAGFAINSRGWVAGISQNGLLDSVTGIPQIRATLWRGRTLQRLGTLGGDESLGLAVTNDGAVTGMATTDVTFDPFAVVWPSPTHAFIWSHGSMKDLGTLGGPDSFLTSWCSNPGLVVGGSYTNDVPNETTGTPTMDPFAWDGSQMINLGTFGGSFGAASCGNHRGQIVGQSNLAGDLTAHPFLWQRGRLHDLGTLGGDGGTAIWINDRGDVVGEADTAGNQSSHAFLWRNGTMRDLGTLGDSSRAEAVNAHTQVVGQYVITGRTEPPRRHPFLWEDGGPMVDLNDLIPSGSSLELVEATNINDRGEIMGVGVTGRCFPDFCGHAYMLIPCVGTEAEGCGNDAEEIAAASAAMNAKRGSVVLTRRASARERAIEWGERMRQRYRLSSR